MRKYILFIVLLLIFLVLVIFIFDGFEKKCKYDSDCAINNCCNPSECILKEKAPSCTSIVVCNETQKKLNCGCIEGKCAVK